MIHEQSNFRHQNMLLVPTNIHHEINLVYSPMDKSWFIVDDCMGCVPFDHLPTSEDIEEYMNQFN